MFVRDCRILILWFVCSHVGLAFPAHNTAVAERQAAPLTCVEPEYRFDFGRRGDVVLHSFYLTNRSADTLTIQSVKTSCGCTVVSVEEGTEIPSGEEIEVPVHVRLDRLGETRSTVFLQIVGQEDLVTLTVIGNVDEDCPEFLDFGNIRKGEGLTQTFSVKRYQGQPDLEILELRFREKLFTAELVEPSDASAATIAVHLKPDIPFGRFEERLEIVTNDTNVPVKSVTVKGYIFFPVEVSEKAVHFGALRLKSVQARTVEVFSPYGEEVHIANVENSKETVFSWRVDDKAPRRPDRVPIVIETTGEIPEGTPGGIVKSTLTFSVRVGDSDQRVRVEVYGLFN